MSTTRSYVIQWRLGRIWTDARDGQTDDGNAEYFNREQAEESYPRVMSKYEEGEFRLVARTTKTTDRKLPC